MKDFYGKDYSELKNKKLWLFDMDGTIYLGDEIIDGTLKLLENISAAGGKYVFITNNSSRGIDAYLKKVRAMGIKADESNFYTSVDASVAVLKELFNKKLIYAQGTKSFTDHLKAEGLNIATEYDEKAECVIVGTDTELTAKKLSDTCRTLVKDIPFYAANPDWACPTEFGYIPDCGSMCFGIEKATGKSPIFLGKPNPFMVNEVIRIFGADKKDAVVVGDSIRTDISSGVNAGVDTVLVLSGADKTADCDNSAVKPTFVIKSVKEISVVFG